MTDSEFFQQTQCDWYTEFVNTEVTEIFVTTSVHNEIFEFADVPF